MIFWATESDGLLSIHITQGLPATSNPIVYIVFLSLIISLQGKEQGVINFILLDNFSSSIYSSKLALVLLLKDSVVLLTTQIWLEGTWFPLTPPKIKNWFWPNAFISTINGFKMHSTLSLNSTSINSNLFSLEVVSHLSIVFE